MLRKKLGVSISILLITSFFCVTIKTNLAYAELQSQNYRFDESAIDSGSLVEGSSNNYKSTTATGDLIVGESSSSDYQIQTGSKTTDDPALSFHISSGNITFGDFTTSSATVTTATFSVTNYTSYGYVVQIFGNSPTNGNHSIEPMATTESSTPGIEQFGINLVTNSLPTNFGANPNNGQFGFGIASANYNTENKYRFVSGEIIASAPKSSGTTLYTISYIVNVSNMTPGGRYTCGQTLIVTGTY